MFCHNSVNYGIILLILSVIPMIAGLTEYCPRINFKHFYNILNENGSENVTVFENYFPFTRVNDYAMTGHLCVNESGFPVMRRCLGNKKWEDLDEVTCQLNPATNELSESLNQIRLKLNYGASYRASMPNNSRDTVKTVSRIVSQAKNEMQPVDVVNINSIISAVSKEPKTEAVSTEMIGLYNELMNTNSSALELSARLNATNDLLHNFEDYMNQVAGQLGPLKSCKMQKSVPMPPNLVDVKVRKGLQILIAGNLSIFYLYPECNNYTGIALYDRAGPNRINCGHHQYWYRLLYANQSVNDLKSEPGLQTATYLTDELWTDLQRSGATYLIFKIYANDAFFIETDWRTGRSIPQSHVLSIDIPQVSAKLPHRLVFLLRKENSEVVNNEEYCGYWNYGKWAKNGVTTTQSGSADDPIVVCYTNHLTQFAFLVGGSYKQQRDAIKDQDRKNQLRDEAILDDITAFGCGLSLFGLLGIWLTAAVSKKWRSQQGTKLLLNLSLALALLFVLLLLVYMNERMWRYSFSRNHAGCIALGALLQYSVLLLFSWMLLIGYLQYQRLVTVLVVRSQHLVLRVATVAWLMPLLPTLLLLFIDSNSYSPIQSDDDGTLCYPSGHGLAYGVLLPIGLVLIVNVYLFVRILYSISQIQNRSSELIWPQLRLSILLFSLLGLTWIFGICTRFRLGLAFSYLFCITATIQGFVLFVYFVLLDKVARDAWLEFIVGRQQMDSSTTKLSI